MKRLLEASLFYPFFFFLIDVVPQLSTLAMQCIAVHLIRLLYLVFSLLSGWLAASYQDLRKVWKSGGRGGKWTSNDYVHTILPFFDVDIFNSESRHSWTTYLLKVWLKKTDTIRSRNTLLRIVSVFFESDITSYCFQSTRAGLL